MKLKNKLLLGGLTAVFLAVMSFSAWKIWVIRSEYHTGEAAYEDISHMILLPQKAAEPQPPVINKPLKKTGSGSLLWLPRESTRESFIPWRS